VHAYHTLWHALQPLVQLPLPPQLPALAGDAGGIDTAAAEELLSAAQEFLAFTARFA